MKPTRLLTAALCSAVLLPALAQEPMPAPHPMPGMHAAGPLMRMHIKPVKNAPYSAEVISEVQQNLPDGNQIVRKTSSLSYRDSAGRTRQEIRDAKGVVRSITIHDPVEGSTYLLWPETHSATRLPARRAMLGQHARDMLVKRVERRDQTEDVHIRAAGPELADRLGPALAGAFGDMRWSGKGSTRSLGSKEIDGIKAEGKLRSYEIPAGAVGNRDAIVVTDESWQSPDLQVLLYSKHSDPRSGERIYRLENLKREEPAGTLFSVPSDYTVKELGAGLPRAEKK